MSYLIERFVVLCCCIPLLVSGYLVGCGISDVTGPSTEVNFMGYAVPSQRGSGIHLRLRSRAFIIAEDGDDSENRVVFVSIDGGMGSDLVNMRVLESKKNMAMPYTWIQVAYLEHIRIQDQQILTICVVSDDIFRLC